MILKKLTINKILLVLFALYILTLSCEDTPDPVEECVTQNYNIEPISQSSFFCGQAGPKTLSIMSDINELWGSRMFPCVCGPDFPLPFCSGNAAVLNPRAYGPSVFAYIYYDPNMLQYLENVGNGSLLGPAWFLAHEAGHNIQNNFGIQFAATKGQELSADCFAGYFIGKLICDGMVNQADINGLLNSICATADPVAQPWFAPGAHGTCNERLAATQRGIDAYMNGLDPLVACI